MWKLFATNIQLTSLVESFLAKFLKIFVLFKDFKGYSIIPKRFVDYETSSSHQQTLFNLQTVQYIKLPVYLYERNMLLTD